MKITTRATTVGQLLASLEGADHDEEVTFARPNKKQPVPCWCGCGGTTKSKFVPGHDSKYHGLAKRVARGEANEAEALAGLPHEASRTAFVAYAETERPLHEQRVAEKEAAKVEREAAKAEKAAEKAADEAREAAVLDHYDAA